MICRKWQTKSCSCIFERHEPNKVIAISFIKLMPKISFVHHQFLSWSILCQYYILSVRWMYLTIRYGISLEQNILWICFSTFWTTSIITCCSNCIILRKIPFSKLFSFYLFGEVCWWKHSAWQQVPLLKEVKSASNTARKLGRHQKINK